MIERRPFNRLGGEDHGWLKAKQHFSVADYRDPTRMGWGSLRVWNDDELTPDTGFSPHGAVSETIEYALGEQRYGYLVPASGAVEVNGVWVDARDGGRIKDVAVISITAIEDAELVVVDAA